MTGRVTGRRLRMDLPPLVTSTVPPEASAGIAAVAAARSRSPNALQGPSLHTTISEPCCSQTSTVVL